MYWSCPYLYWVAIKKILTRILGHISGLSGPSLILRLHTAKLTKDDSFFCHFCIVSTVWGKGNARMNCSVRRYYEALCTSSLKSGHFEFFNPCLRIFLSCKSNPWQFQNEHPECLNYTIAVQILKTPVVIITNLYLSIFSRRRFHPVGRSPPP